MSACQTSQNPLIVKFYSSNYAYGHMLVPIEVQQNVSYGVAVTTKDSSDGDGYAICDGLCFLLIMITCRTNDYIYYTDVNTQSSDSVHPVSSLTAMEDTDTYESITEHI